MMRGAPVLAAILATIVSGIAFDSPAAAAPAAPDTCVVHATASLDSLVHGDFASARRNFSAATANLLSAAKLEQAWQSVQKSFGSYHGHGAAHRVPFHGRSVVVARLDLAIEPLDFVVGCDASNRITMFYFLKPSVVEPPPPVVAHADAGVRVEPLKVPSPVGPLRGALTLPAGKGPFPAVVLVQGSGAHDLDETVGPNKPFRDIANGLAKAGIASLRYDKRTVDYALKTAANPDFTIDDEVTDDALAALHLLAKQTQVDPRRVFVLGHSLGAQMAPRIAQRDPQLAGVIMLAAPARPLLDVVKEQVRELGAAHAESGQRIEGSIAADDAEQALLAKANPRHPPPGSFGGAPQSWWLSLHQYDQVAAAESLSIPMLILQGENDFQVSPQNDFDAWKRALAGSNGVTFHLYPGLSHLFTPGPTKTMADYAQPGHVDSKVIADIANWIKAQPAL